MAYSASSFNGNSSNSNSSNSSNYSSNISTSATSLFANVFLFSWVPNSSSPVYGSHFPGIKPILPLRRCHIFVIFLRKINEVKYQSSGTRQQLRGFPRTRRVAREIQLILISQGVELVALPLDLGDLTLLLLGQKQHTRIISTTNSHAT